MFIHKAFPRFVAIACLVGCTQIPEQMTSERFDFKTHALSFSNFGDKYEVAKFNTPLAIRMFGRESVCTSTAEPCIVDPNIQLFVDDVNASLASGHSEGFAVLSQLFATGKLKATDFGAQKPSDFSLSDGPILQELAYWSATQRIEAVHANDKKFEAKEVMAFLAEILKPTNADGYRMLLAIKKEDGTFEGGHAVVPFGYFKSDKDGEYVIRLYDSNFPSEERRMTVDVKANVWRYDGSLDSFTPLIYEGNAQNKNMLYFSPVSLRVGTFTPPHAGEGLAVSIGAGSGLVSAEGIEVGIKDGQVVENGGLVLPGAANCACSNPNTVMQMLLGKAGLPQKITLTATGATISGGSVTVQVNDGAKNGKSYKTEEVTVSADGKATVNHKFPAENDSRTVVVTTKNKDGSTTSVTVTTSGNTESITVDTSDPNNVKVTGTSKAGTGNTSQVTVTVTNTKPDGTAKTVTSTSTSGEGRNIDVSVQPIAGTSTVNTGLPADSCKNGRRDFNEIGIDCGESCALKPPAERVGSGRCARFATCQKDIDCQIGDSCIITNGRTDGTCSEPRCGDGIKNGDETDVDCGATSSINKPCTGCGLGKACMGSNTCGQGLLCDSNVCVAASPLKHRLTITGLGEWARVTVESFLDDKYAKRVVDGNGTGAPIELEFSATKKLRVSLGQTLGGFSCAFVEPADNATYPWSWDAPATGGMSSRRTVSCQRTYGAIKVPFVINGCKFKPLGDSTVELLYIRDQDLVKFYNQNDPLPRQPLYVSSYQPRDAGGVLDLNLNINGTPPRYDIGIGPDTAGFLYYSAIGNNYNSASPERFTMSCLPDAPLTGTIGVVSPVNTARVFCNCTTTVDAGVDAGRPDAGVDAGVDAGRPDAGVDAGFDAGRPDAGVDAGFDAGRPDAGFDAGFDAGRPDAGVDAGFDAGAPSCSTDSQCGAGANCYCASNPGSCAGAGVCIGTKVVISTPTTNGVISSGSYTVPAGCTKVSISAWGASGGNTSVFIPFPMMRPGGGGGFAAGAVPAMPGDVITAWIGAAGKPSVAMGTGGLGSFVGSLVNGGDGDPGMAPGAGGGGLTSVRQTGSTTQSFSIPGGGGAAANGAAEPGGGPSAGGAPGPAGDSAAPGSEAGGGGSGQPGGLAGIPGTVGNPGAFGSLPSGVMSVMGNFAEPGGTTRADFSLCPNGTASGMFGGNGCVVVRCAR
jgi:hypothetical protein